MVDGEDKSGEPFVARRAELIDSEGISKLVKRQTENVFGRLNVEDVIEKANLAITLAGKDENVLAFAAFYDHPLDKEVKQSEWESWFHMLCDCPQANALNSLFLRQFVSEEEFSQNALAEILRTVFIAVPLLQYVFLPVPSAVDIGTSLATQFSPLSFNVSEKDTPTNESDTTNGEAPPTSDQDAPTDQALPTTNDAPPTNNEPPPPTTTVYVSHRHLHYPMLHVRPAIVEDNDDLLPILQKSSPESLAEDYGDYFIAELIESQDESHQTVVAEVNGKGVGFISVTSQVDLSILWECYQLESYHGLRKLCEEDEIITTPSNENQLPPTEDTRTTTPTPERADVENHQVDKPENLKESSASSIASQKSSKNEGSAGAVSIATTDSTPIGSTHSFHTSPLSENQYSLTGPSNVLSVQLFCIDEQYESRSVDLLPAVFQKFPEYDFLVISQPQDMLEFPLLQHFTRVPPRVDSTMSHDLYVVHKCSLIDSIAVRPVQSRDVEGVSKLVSALKAESTVMEDVQRCIAAGRDPISEGGSPLYAFVAECINQIVGIVILRPEESLSYLQAHYNIEDYVYYSQHRPEEHMNLHHLLINPVFAPHLKHFMKESMRLSHSNNLYYPLTNTMPVARRPFSVTLALSEMVPVKPRRQIVYPEGLNNNTPGREVMEQRPLYTLYHTNRKLSMETKIAINARVVFIGASDVCLSALETLVFSPHLKFNNLTLVSPDGLSQSTATSLLPDSCSFFNKALNGVSLDTWVNVVTGSLSAINRNKRELTVSMDDKESTLPYDYLVITTGTQYSPDRPRTGDIPGVGVVSIKGDLEDKHCLEDARALIGIDGNVVVYGSSLASLSTLRHILEDWSISGDRVTWIQPHSIESLLPDSVHTTLGNILDDAGVKILQGYVLDRYETTPTANEGSKLCGVTCFRKKDNEIEEILIECEVMFCLETKSVDRRTFKAVNDSCLVYDHRIVIDSDNSTNDTRILAAGSVTKFSRIYRTQYSHKDFNSHEVGQKLAATILTKLDPTALPQSDTPTSLSGKKLIPTYTQPKLTYTYLPGGYYYLDISKPSLKTSVNSNKDIELVTITDNGYFRLWLNEYERVQTITVFSTKAFEVSNYICLYNIHEKLLNNMLSRWKDGLIQDFFTYFREEWSCTIFHDRFVEFLTEIQGLLETPDEGDEQSLMEKTREIVEESSHVSVEYNMKKFLPLTDILQSAVHKRLHRFLHYNGYHLTMYAHPDMV